MNNFRNIAVVATDYEEIVYEKFIIKEIIIKERNYFPGLIHCVRVYLTRMQVFIVLNIV